jgi:5-methylcytosine-specific restriction endonuclease McrA
MERRYFGERLEDRAAFMRRIFCDRDCMAQWMEGQTKVENDKNGRRQSAKTAAQQCEKCGRQRDRTRMYVHHKDENPQNNEPSNLMTLCGSCHRRLHSPNYTGTGERRERCAYCEMPSYRLGLCCTHLTRLKKHGDPLAVKVKIGSDWVLTRRPG